MTLLKAAEALVTATEAVLHGPGAPPLATLDARQMKAREQLAAAYQGAVAAIAAARPQPHQDPGGGEDALATDDLGTPRSLLRPDAGGAAIEGVDPLVARDVYRG